jgi:hypothetical protein
VQRTHIILLAVLVAAVPAATAGSLFSSAASVPSGRCFIAGASGYRITTGAKANVTVRIDNDAAQPMLRMQIVDDPAKADFVLVDDGQGDHGCAGANAIENIRVDAAAAKPDLTVALSRAPASTKIYVRSTRFSDEDAAALYAVMWNAAHKPGAMRRVAGR